MIIIVLDKVPNSVHGKVAQSFFEIYRNVFIGNVSAKVRDSVWSMLDQNQNVSAVMAYSYPTIQGFELLCTGNMNNKFIDIDGIKILMNN
jgi:CRISPR-associated protein Cas2